MVAPSDASAAGRAKRELPRLVKSRSEMKIHRSMRRRARDMSIPQGQLRVGVDGAGWRRDVLIVFCM
jgi:hypothetical protein